jgi:predicted sulfurtransferase
MLSFYHFEPLPDPLACRDSLFESLQEIPGLRGTFYLASEGVNAQMAVPPEDLDTLLQVISTDMPWDPFQNNPPNLSDVVPIDTPTFDRLIVRIRDFVLRDGIPSEIELDWSGPGGPGLSPLEWHDGIVSSGKTATLLDCRNGYESDQGTFQGSIPLDTDTFQESWDQIDQLTEDLPRDEPLRIFCTGGIRCVKVGAYLKQHLGFSNVKRLQHGIIGYQHWLDQEGNDSVWEGDNFLFDKRRFGEKAEPTN